MKRNTVHSDGLIKDAMNPCVHRFNDGTLKNQCELLGSECHNWYWSEQICGFTIYINKLQRINGVK